MTKIKENSELNKIVAKGWDILVENLGISDATRFIVAFERGEGDSVKEIKDFWGDRKIEEIHKEIIEAKRKRLI